MSGGRWGYQQRRIEEQAEHLALFLRAVAKSEHIIDWAESGDTSRYRDADGSGAERELYELWLATFEEAFGG